MACCPILLYRPYRVLLLREAAKNNVARVTDLLYPLCLPALIRLACCPRSGLLAAVNMLFSAGMFASRLSSGVPARAGIYLCRWAGKFLERLCVPVRAVSCTELRWCVSHRTEERSRWLASLPWPAVFQRTARAWAILAGVLARGVLGGGWRGRWYGCGRMVILPPSPLSGTAATRGMNHLLPSISPRFFISPFTATVSAVCAARLNLRRRMDG